MVAPPANRAAPAKTDDNAPGADEIGKHDRCGPHLPDIDAGQPGEGFIFTDRQDGSTGFCPNEKMDKPAQEAEADQQSDRNGYSRHGKGQGGVEHLFEIVLHSDDGAHSLATDGPQDGRVAKGGAGTALSPY